MNHCRTCGKEIADNRTVCSRSCAAIYGNKSRTEEALTGYLKNPNLCQNCGKPILPKSGQKLPDVRRKKFCNQRCGAIKNNERLYHVSDIRKCEHCGEEFKVERSQITKKLKNTRICINCRYVKDNFLQTLTLAELFSRRKHWQSARSTIQGHARRVYWTSDQPKICKLCGYNRHVDVAHIIAVSAFSKDTLITVVNDLSNLMALCPNHHWEYDAGLLTLDEISVVAVE